MSLILTLLTRYWKELLFLALVGVLIWRIDHNGFERGKNYIQTAWDSEKKEAAEELTKLKEEKAKHEAEHRDADKEIADALANAEKDHAVAIAEQQREHDRRMRASEGRAAYYRNMSQAGSAQCSDLAGHATELDRALEGGRDLVERLRTTLGLREQQIQSLSDQINNDRKLFNGPEQ